MAEVAKGQVGLIYSNKVRGTTLYSIKLEDDDTWYRTQRDNPEDAGIEKGDYVTFEYTVKKNQSIVDMDTLKKVEAPRSRGGNKSGGSASSGSVSDSGVSLRELRTGLGFGREQAIKVTQMLLEHNALVLPSKTKVAERHDAVLGFIDNLSRQYFNEGFALTEADYEAALEYVSTKSGDDLLDLYEDGDDDAGGDD